MFFFVLPTQMFFWKTLLFDCFEQTFKYLLKILIIIMLMNFVNVELYSIIKIKIVIEYIFSIFLNAIWLK